MVQRWEGESGWEVRSREGMEANQSDSGVWGSAAPGTEIFFKAQA
jgi:hypothetical protein